ncbi:MAG: DUF4350 domain-containing protein [Ignavibacteriae bacterium]|nr:MAG: DUF4350 domain-containing protein [Ignavibacteriota bacterium]
MKKIIPFLLFALNFSIFSQQVSDTAFNFSINNPAYEPLQGPVIMIDEYHYNFHTLEGRYSPFVKLLRNDGYILKSYDDKFDYDKLKECRILVISNPLDSSNRQNWTLPNPSAFTKDEISAVKKWVEGGGRLFLIADHMPFAGAAHDLAFEFGFEFYNGFAAYKNQSMYDKFIKADNSLAENEITVNLDTVLSFTGSAFKIPASAKPIISLNGNYTVLMPVIAWEFNDSTPTVSGEGLYQGAFMEFGKGKIVVFGEAAMFSAQIAGSGNNQTKMGFNLPEAKNNIKLLLNIIHWLDR